ncbi:hypothetical protein ART_3688 [Arthrobacter sp. PAMC 25486]|uniref:TM2 domain-containing protein n=1 Tax=Arthrobacter sp. PAMC 25486 TaxID=1494608 RepID=UPI000535E1C6|nr:TM2 domain-containing protein [Arthrobacter sp. PAMC 25486]AIY03287.1 hypothetical protein ART_3688 [Arthrobacter sp. PAMC 25486]
MSENNQPEQNPLDFGKASEVPAGYDQPAPPAYGAPGYQEPAAPQPPSYQQPEPQSPYPGAQQAYPQQNVQQNPYQQQGGQQGYQQQGFQQPYPQPGYPMVGGQQKSKVVAGILGILLGGLGIHNFYLGKNKIALTQLLVSVVSFGFLYPIMGIWGLIEGILILVGHENYRTDSNGVPLKD